jgi:DNA-binding response OmpR family regulator
MGGDEVLSRSENLDGEVRHLRGLICANDPPLVEDEGPVAMLVETMLDDLGCAVVLRAASVREALDLVRRGGFDVALLDVILPAKRFSRGRRASTPRCAICLCQWLRRGRTAARSKGHPDWSRSPFQLGDLQAALVASAFK